MELNRTFAYHHEGREIQFSVTYDPKTHSFNVVEDDNINYILSYNPTTREWTSTEDPGPSISVDKLAQLVQKSFGVFV